MRKLVLSAFPLFLVACGQLISLPQNLVLLQGQEEYEAQIESEVVLRGILSPNPNPARNPAGRVSRYTFKTLDFNFYLYDVRDKDDLIKSFIGKNIYLKGKIVDTLVGDIVVSELWPASISLNAEGS